MGKARIIFLGSGGGRKIVASQARATGGFVVQDGEEQIHIDPGPGALVHAARLGIDSKNTNMVLVSHFHIDHSNDVNAIIDALTFGGLEKKGVLVTSNFYENDNLTEFHSKAVGCHITLKPGEKMNFKDLAVYATRTEEHEMGNIGYKVFTPDFVLGYTSDTAFFPGLVDEFIGCDVLVINTIKPSGKKLAGHMSADDAVELVKGVKPKLAILSHFGRSMIEADPANEAMNVQKKSGIPTIAANDGLVVDVSEGF